MSDIHGSAERSGRPSPAWLKKLATGLVEKVEARGMTLTIEGAEVVVAERVRAVAATMKITERSARAYFDHDGLAALADGLVETFADEEPGTDLLTLPRTGALPVSGIGRLVAALAQCHLFFETYQAVDADLSRSRSHEVTELISMVGLVQADHQTGDNVWVPRALFVRIARMLEVVAELTPDSRLRTALRGDAIIAKAGLLCLKTSVTVLHQDIGDSSDG
ncbi:hypothetical protein, partial [Mycolicibacterium alvei]